MKKQPSLEKLLKTITVSIKDEKERSIVELYLTQPNKLSKKKREEAVSILTEKYPELAAKFNLSSYQQPVKRKSAKKSKPKKQSLREQIEKELSKQNSGKIACIHPERVNKVYVIDAKNLLVANLEEGAERDYKTIHVQDRISSYEAQDLVHVRWSENGKNILLVDMVGWDDFPYTYSHHLHNAESSFYGLPYVVDIKSKETRMLFAEDQIIRQILSKVRCDAVLKRVIQKDPKKILFRINSDDWFSLEYTSKWPKFLSGFNMDYKHQNISPSGKFFLEIGPRNNYLYIKPQKGSSKIKTNIRAKDIAWRIPKK